MSTLMVSQELGPILYYYDLYPEKVEDYGKVKKIYTKRGDYALKQTNIDREQADWLVHVARRLMKLGYRNCVPLIPTKYGEYTITANNKTYYVMPWIYEGESKGNIPLERKLMKQMGTIHRLTVKSQAFIKETIDDSYQVLQQRWDSRRVELERFADGAEKRIYMSPFELSFLTHYQHLSAMITGAQQHVKAWYDACLEKEKYRSVLCHGKLSRRHVLLHETGEPLLFNFERASLDCPARDLASFYRHSLGYTLWDDEEMFRWQEIYEKELALFPEEKQLLAGYLHFPDAIIHSVISYIEKPANMTELMHVKRMEKRLIAMRKSQRLAQKLIQ